jgi:VWFA-related protein
MRWNLAAAVVGLLLAGTTGVIGGQAPSQPVFRSGVELVTIDVVATGRDGNPIYNLKASDFELFEDGQSQPIKAFQFLNYSTTPIETPPPVGVVSNQVEPGGVFALVLDDIGYYVTETQEVRRAAQRFLDRALQPHDHVAVVRSGFQSGFFLSADRTLALDAALSTAGRRDRGIRLEQAGSPDTVGAGDFDTASPGETGKESFEVLGAVVEKLRPIPARRKAVVWFSRGGNLPANWETNLEIGQPVGRNEDALRRLINQARLANVAIYTVDPRGLVAPSTAGRDNPGAQDFADIGTHRDLAVATGGRPIVNANDIDGALEKMAVENRAYYLLGYEPSPAGNARNPKARRIKVTTSAPGVALLHRSLYLPGSDPRAPLPALAESPLPVRNLPIMLAPASVALDRRKRGVLLPFEIGRDLRDGTSVEYTVLALDAAGKVVARATGKGTARNGRLVGQAGLPLDAKTYQVRFAAKAVDPDVEGLAFATVRVPEGNAAEPECAGFVFEQAGQRDGLRSFVRDAPMTVSTLVSAEKLAGALAFAMGRPGGVPQKTWAVPAGQPLAQGLWRVALNLTSLPEGDIELQLLHDGLLLHDNCLAQFAAH